MSLRGGEVQEVSLVVGQCCHVEWGKQYVLPSLHQNVLMD